MNLESNYYRDALDIVFQNRNRTYGAYLIRREYPNSMGKALGLGVLMIVFAFGWPFLSAKFGHNFSIGKMEVVATPSEPPIIETPPMRPPPQPPPPQVAPTPVRAMSIFVPPTLTTDDVKDTPPLSNDELLKDKAGIGSKKIDGTEDGPIDLEGPPKAPPSFIQNNTPSPTIDSIETYVEKPPSFPGGEAELLKYLNQNIKYPTLAHETGIQGRVILSFVVNKNGGIDDIKIIKDPGGGCGKEAVRVVQSMPAWYPGEQHGKAVRVRFTLPVKFELKD